MCLPPWSEHTLVIKKSPAKYVIFFFNILGTMLSTILEISQDNLKRKKKQKTFIFSSEIKLAGSTAATEREIQIIYNSAAQS